MNVLYPPSPFYLPAPDVFMTDKWFHVRIEEWVVLDPVDTHTYIQIDTETDRYIYWTDTYIDRQIQADTHRQTDTETDRQILTDRQIQRQTETHGQTYTDTDIYTDRYRYRYRQVQYKQMQIKTDTDTDRYKPDR